MSQQVLTISQLNEYVRSIIDSDRILSSVAVRGEISNHKLYPSGHHYFTLKDDTSALKCIMFKAQGNRLRFRPENGMKVIALGKVSVYPRDGVYQLYCNSMIADGIGDLHVAFEQLKKKLDAEGLFSPAFKKPVPAYPGHIGIITSPAGAAVRDMLRIIKARFPLSKVRLFPVRVQGEEAAAEIAGAIAFANQHHLADVLIVGRGGGSIEDLWAFNEECVARAIFSSDIPVISAVGHEPDVTISDYVADLRAATPSNAAELVVMDQFALRQHLDQLQSAMNMSMSVRLAAMRKHLLAISSSPVLSSANYYIRQRKLQLDSLRSRTVSAAERYISERKHKFISLTAKLDAMSPFKVMARGYAIITDDNRAPITSVHDITPGNQLYIDLSDGRITATVSKTEEISYE